MGIGSISFWQQDQNFWARSQSRSQSLASSAALMSVMSDAETSLSSGLSQIANQTALNRVNSALSAAVQQALQSNTGSSSSSSTSSASSSSSASASSAASSSATPPVPAPAIGTGTVALTAGTSLFSLGILAKQTISVTDGTFTTNYKSTGTDTVADLINAINAGSARVVAWLNDTGHLVITSKNNIDTISISGTYPSAIGFGPANSSFSPTVPASSSSASSNSSSLSNSSTASSSTSTSGTTSATKSSATSAANATSGVPTNSALALQTTGTAEILLASNGSAGYLVNLLA